MMLNVHLEIFALAIDRRKASPPGLLWTAKEVLPLLSLSNEPKLPRLKVLEGAFAKFGPRLDGKPFRSSKSNVKRSIA